MTEHSHIMGGSTAAQRINCPGSFQLEQDLPDGPDSEFARQGSMLHAAMEMLLTADPPDMTAAEPLIDELEGQNLGFDGQELTRDLLNVKVVPALDAWFRVRDEYELDDWFIEQRVSLEDLIDGAFGTSDLICKDTQNRLHILDWKFGDGVAVSAEGNMGLAFYAAAALYDPDPEMIEFTDPEQLADECFLHIVQPRSGSHADPLDTWSTTLDWIEKFVDQAVQAMDKARGKNPPLKAGSWCRWCKAKATCPEQLAMADEALSQSPSTMTAVELASALEKAHLLTDWCKEVFALGQREAENGVAIPGWKLVAGRSGARKWAEEKKVEAICKKRKLKIAQMYGPRKLLTPAQFEKKNPDLYCKILNELVTSSSPKLTLVPDSDKRPAVTGAMQLLANAMDQAGISKQET